MIPVRTFNGQKVAVFGLGGSGLATAEALVAGGADVVAYDDGEAGRTKAMAAGLAVRDLRELDWSTIAAFVLSPGVPLTHPEPHWSVKRAREAGVEIIGDIELLARERQAAGVDSPLVAITGTNGKSTTTALIAHLLTSAGRDVQLGGNIGRAVLTLEPPAPGRIYVIECSSFQIDLAPSLDPTIGVHLNLSPDHLDRHGTMENYAAIKERLIKGSELAIVGVDDFGSLEIAGGVRRRGQGVVRISAKVPYEADVFYRDGAVHAGARVFPLTGIASLRGAHNGQNAAAAIAAVRALGLTDDLILSGLATFPGLPHRMEEVGRLGKVIIVNDSKATNADSSAQALAAFGPIYWILGGKAKEGGIETLIQLFPRVAKAYLIGSATDQFAATLDVAGVPYERSGTLDVALASAARDAAQSDAAEPVVLLSPACASYDQFKGFEDRGDQFRQMVLALPGISRRGLIAGKSEVA
jgi:UDP-N-acetylmuramoylalanine--D-glutamate ligase